MLKMLATTASLLLTVAAVQAKYEAFANGYVWTNLVAGSAKLGYDTQTTGAAAVSLFTEEFYDDLAGHTGHATSALDIKAEAGKLHVLGEAMATNNIYPGFDGGNAGFQFDTYDTSKPQASAVFRDSLMPTSTTLPVGTVVEFAVHMKLEGTRGSTVQPDGATLAYLRAAFSGNSYSSLLVLPLGTSTLTDDFIVQGQIGYEMPFGSSLEVRGSTAAYAGSGPAYATVDAWNTGEMTFRSITPGASFTTSSGYRYQAVPEPTTVAALSLGALTLVRRRKRQ